MCQFDHFSCFCLVSTVLGHEGAREMNGCRAEAAPRALCLKAISALANLFLWPVQQWRFGAAWHFGGGERKTFTRCNHLAASGRDLGCTKRETRGSPTALLWRRTKNPATHWLFAAAASQMCVRARTPTPAPKLLLMLNRPIIGKRHWDAQTGFA